jgi:phosphoribosyl 1,2-cyclic phosphodiesterase
VKLTFLGTRANTEVKTRLHQRHSALQIDRPSGRLMIDCGADWSGRASSIAPDAILLTHAHPDHAEGLRLGAPCPVYATGETWRAIDDFPIAERHRISCTRAAQICGYKVRAYRLVHSLLSPAVGYRIEADGRAFFYAPDIVAIEDGLGPLRGVSLYVGDGSSISRPLVRRRDGALFGHTTIRAQIGWCAKAGVPEAVFTHCGTEIMRMNARTAAAKIRRLGVESGVQASVATDGATIDLDEAGPYLTATVGASGPVD